MHYEGQERRAVKIEQTTQALTGLAEKVRHGYFETDEAIAQSLREILDRGLSPWSGLEEFKNPVRKFTGREYVKKETSPRIGDRVIVRNTMLYNGRRGKLIPASNHPEDIWDYNVILDGVRDHIIGVTRDQVTKEK